MNSTDPAPMFAWRPMGHADIQLTLNVYGHLLKDKEAEHAQTAEELATKLIPAQAPSYRKS